MKTRQRSLYQAKGESRPFNKSRTKRRSRPITEVATWIHSERRHPSRNYVSSNYDNLQPERRNVRSQHHIEVTTCLKARGYQKQSRPIIEVATYILAISKQKTEKKVAI